MKKYTGQKNVAVVVNSKQGFSELRAGRLGTGQCFDMTTIGLKYGESVEQWAIKNGFNVVRK